jgi:Phosphotransferase System HPr (HPr) Family
MFLGKYHVSATLGGSAMTSKIATITNKVGLHARPATFLIQKANEFSASIWLEKDERRVNAKSLLGVLSLGVGAGESVKVISDGPDEEDAVNVLYDLITSEFAE